MTRPPRWRAAARWCLAVAAAGVAFEGLDALAIQNPAVSWIPLASPALVGGVAASLAGGRARSRLLAAAAVAWVRIGADRAIGVAHGVRQPIEVEAAVAALFGIPWMVLALLGGLAVVLVRFASRRDVSGGNRAGRRQGSSPRVT